MAYQSVEGKAHTVKKIFSRETTVSIEINSSADNVWKLLTNAHGYPKWNSTILSIQGSIGLQSKIVLKATLDPKREFKLRVKEFVPNKRMKWGDAMGNRLFTLEERSPQITRFTMVEKIGGPLFPLFAAMIPPFDEAFDRFAADLKKAAETQVN